LRDSGGESQEQSTSQQKREIEAYCQRYGLMLVRVFEDAARSGGSTKARAAFLEMIDASTQPENRPQGLLVWNYARFARDMDDSAFYRAVIRKNKMVIHSLTDPIPPGEFSRVIETLIDYANEEKRRQTSRDVKRGLMDRTRAGYAPGGPPPRGYKAVKEEIGLRRNGQPRNGTKWEPDPELAPLVTLAFKMRAEGKSLPEIMEATQGRLYKSKNCFSTFFRNKSYLGIGHCGDLEIENHHPALVDRETWQAVRKVQEQARRNVQGNLIHPKRVNNPSLLSGLAVCIHCGTPIIRDSTGGTKWKAYLCGKKRNRSNYHACEGRQIGMAKADEAVLNAVLTRILTPDFVTDLLDELRAQISDTTQIDRQEQEKRQSLATCEKAIDRLLSAIEETESPSAKARLKERENERTQLQLALSALEARRAAAQLTISPEALALVLSVWSGEIEEARQAEDIRNLQSLLRRFVTKVELGYNMAKIWYTYPIDAFAVTRLTGNSSSGPPVPQLCCGIVPKLGFRRWLTD
jgi:DNA invertase Pin-like site-specific DNA recombinase